MKILKNATLFAPQALGRRDLLIAGGRIAAMASEILSPAWDCLEVIDLEGRWVFPGFIDSHIHIAGAGGEGGPANRTRPLAIADIISGGITTVIGCLGTDGITRTVESVLMSARELKAQGLSAWIYSGAYQVPPPTITGDVAHDITLIEEVIGLGEIALGDHRSSFPSEEELVKLFQRVRLGALLAGKAGVINIHIGDHGRPFDLIQAIAERDGIGYRRFQATHCNRSRAVFEAAKAYGKKGVVDLTTSAYPYYRESEIKPSTAYHELRDCGVPPEHITFSTDAGGSLPEFDAQGRLLKMVQGSAATLLSEVLDLINQDETQVESALATVTRNPARILELPRKGILAPGQDADLLVLNREKTGIEHLLALGSFLVREGAPVKKTDRPINP